MIASLGEIGELERAGRLLEHLHGDLELKYSWAKDDGQKLCSLANKVDLACSWLVVGIDDKSGSCVGKDEAWARNTEQVISQQINECLDPVQACQSLDCVHLPGGWIVVAKLRNPGSVVRWDKEAYKAAGTTTLRMPPEEVMGLTIKLPGVLDYSRQAWTGPVQESLCRAFVEQCIKSRSTDPLFAGLPALEPLRALERIGISGTNASRILFGNVKYRLVGSDSEGKPFHNEQREGLFGLLQGSFRAEVQALVRRESTSDRPGLPDEGLREALSNAVAHAAYFENDGEVIVEVSPDQVAISNLCIPEAAYFANRWFSRAHKTFNVLLMETLRICGSVDELGRGKRLILASALQAGLAPPRVWVDRVGRYNRWRIVVSGSSISDRLKRLYQRLRNTYEDESDVLLAQALVLWRGEPIQAIQEYLDGESREALTRVLAHQQCPVFYLKDDPRLLVKRWAWIVLGEGKDSKRLSDDEDAATYKLAYNLSKKYTQSKMTAEQFRDYAGMGDSQSEKSLASATLKVWIEKGRVERLGKGRYAFKANHLFDLEDAFSTIASQLLKSDAANLTIPTRS